MWLTKLTKMHNVPEAQQHQLLFTFFKDVEKRPFCYSDKGNEIVMLSHTQPNAESKEVKLTNGQTLMFECCASINPRRYKGRTINPQEFTAEHIKDWFKRRLDGGAYVDYVSFKRMSPHKVRKNDGHEMIFDQTLFFGTLTVMNAKRLEEILATGIGRGCAFGFGLVFLPQVMS